MKRFTYTVRVDDVNNYGIIIRNLNAVGVFKLLLKTYGATMELVQLTEFDPSLPDGKVEYCATDSN